MKPNYRDIAIEFIRQHPGATGLQITEELERNSRSARWFGPKSLLTALFGPSAGMTYAILERLEEEGLIRSQEGQATAERGWRYPLHFYPTGTNR